jgi:hypothetical protein
MSTDLPPLIVADPKELGDLMSGVLDVILAFACELTNVGLLERREIAMAMQRVLEQQTRRDGGPTPAVQYPAASLLKFFSTPVMENGRGRAGLVAIDGGKDDEPPAA